MSRAGIPGEHEFHMPPTKDPFGEEVLESELEVLHNLDPRLIQSHFSSNNSPVVSARDTARRLHNNCDGIGSPLSPVLRSGDTVPVPGENHAHNDLTNAAAEKAQLKRRVARETCRYPCKYGCKGKVFGSQADVNRHHREVHKQADNGDELKTYPCPHKGCSRHENPFARTKNLELHIAKFHGLASQQDFTVHQRQPNRNKAANVDPTIPIGSRETSPSPSAATNKKRNWHNRLSYSPDMPRVRAPTPPSQSGLAFGSPATVLRILRKLKEERDEMMKEISLKHQEIEELEVILLEKFGSPETA